MDIVRTSLLDELNTNGSILVPLHGVSMLPLLRQNKDCAVIVKADFNDLKPMDVVLYYNPDREMYILHRLLWKESNNAMMLGDNCTMIETVSKDRICGRMSEFFHGEKEVKINDPDYQLYISLWARPWKMRVFLLKCRNKVHQAGSKVKRFLLRDNQK